ncbi:ubiquitin carboxyl-terminal hydrolase 36 [Euwallacea fornicatus]|uniref:ubiquitin carboxyl-terminal hydrolase 36 n=1 Tax=Euwallacea fornicatus TaxID=995702 RepID=UPI00338F3F28
MKMPASTMDLLGSTLKANLSKNDEGSGIDAQLMSSAKKAYLSNIEFEPAENYQISVLDTLRSKYMVLKSPENLQINSTKTSNVCNTRTSEENQSDDCLKLAKHELYPFYKIQLGWSSTNNWSVGAGMVNMGNTCYLNSTLQALYHIPSLVNWLVSEKQHAAECVDNGICIICAMRKTLLESQQCNINPVRPILIYNKLRLVYGNLIPGRQEDAHELLHYLIDAMEKSYLQRFRNHNQLDQKVKETTPLNQILGGYLRSAVRCLRCGHISTTFQHFQDLLLDIRKVQTLDEALELYFSREKLDDESYHCESCQKKVQATKQFQLERAPMVLCIQLKRFSISNNKISKHVAFRRRLDLTRYIRQKPTSPMIYRLASIVAHMGPTVSCGHYTAVAQSPSGNYYQFDDSMVHPISHQTLFNTNAYIMLYELESAPHHPKMTPKSKPNSIVSELAPSTSKRPPTKSPLRALSEELSTKTLGIGFTSDKVYGPELPPGRVPQTLGKTVPFKSSLTAVPELTDESSTESSEDEVSKKAVTPRSPATKEPDSSTPNDQGEALHPVSPNASPSTSSIVSTSMSILSSPEAEVKKATTSPSPSKSLVPYETGDTSGSEDSSHSDTSRVTTKASMSEWQVTSTTDASPEQAQWKGKKSGNVVGELFKLSTGGYSAPVSTWNGNRSKLDKEVQQERREDRKRSLADSSEDQGPAKHPKVSAIFGNGGAKSNPGYNPVQEYHNMKNWSNGNGSRYHHKPYYHGNRHKRNFHKGGSFYKNYRFR